MKHGTFKKLLAVMLTMTVILSVGVTTVSAEEEAQIKQVKIVADESGTEVEVSAESGSSSAETDENESTITVTAARGW